MSWLLRFYSSTIGMKAVMAITGLVLYGFVIVHMAGNVQIFMGEHEINKYAQLLHTSEEVVWGARIALLSSIVLHMVSAMRLTMLSGKARAVAYAKRSYSAANFASLSMRFSAILLLAFIVYHLGHFTTGTFFGSGFKVQQGLGVNDVWHNVTTAFKNPLIVAFYVVAQLSLGAHLYHGAVSMFRTLGLTAERQQALLGNLARLLVGAIVVGNISIPVAVLLGIVGGAQ